MYLHEIKRTLYILSMTFNNLVQKNCLLHVLNQKKKIHFLYKVGWTFLFFNILWVIILK